MRILRIFVYLFLSVSFALSGYLQGVNADESFPVIASVAPSDGSLMAYAIMYNAGNGEWDGVIDGLNAVVPNPSFVAIYSGRIYAAEFNDNVYIGTDSKLHNDTQDWWYYRDQRWQRASNVNLLTFDALVFISCDNISSRVSTPNINAVSWAQAQEWYANGPGNDQLQEILDAVNHQTDVIESQYDMEDGENFGVTSIVPEVENKLGVLGFASDTLIHFVDLFNPDNVNATSLTFPGFSIDVDGESYQVWNDITYDLNTLYEHFSFLIDTVRTVLTLFVWIAVFNYLVKEYERFVNG